MLVTSYLMFNEKSINIGHPNQGFFYFEIITDTCNKVENSDTGIILLMIYYFKKRRTLKIKVLAQFI